MLQPTEQLSIAASKGHSSVGQASADRALEGKEQFLKLLVAQISNQNPMDPVDDKQMVSQLAQFSGIEQAIETNQRLESLERTQVQASKLHLSTLIGKEAGASTERVSIVNNGMAPTPLAFTLDAPAKDVTLRLIDKDSNMVRRLEIGAKGPGPTQVTWDGLDKAKRPLAAGNYRLQVTARDMEGAEFSGRTEIRGKIGHVEMSDENPAVFLGTVRVPVGQITTVHE